MGWCERHFYAYAGASCPHCQNEMNLWYRLMVGHIPITDAAIARSAKKSLTDALAGKNWMREVEPMKAPTQQQLNNPAWWDGSAPQTAQFYFPLTNSFLRVVHDCWLEYRPFWATPWKGVESSSIDRRWLHARPTKPQAPEWDDRIPLVGCKCLHGGSGRDEKVTVIAHAYSSRAGKLIVFQREADETISSSSPMHFRPIRTKEQMEREEAIDRAFSMLSEFREARQVLGDLYDAGLLRKGGER